VLAAIDGNAPAARLVDVEEPSPSADLPRPPKTRRSGSIIAGRGPILMIAAGLLLVAVAVVEFVARGGLR
jgi:hypothetical protein